MRMAPAGSLPSRRSMQLHIAESLRGRKYGNVLIYVHIPRIVGFDSWV
jgi:hypothetical protein